MTTRPQDLRDESDHWRDYQRQQADAARRTVAWDHADERAPERTWPALLGAIAYTAVAALLAVVIVAFGFGA